MSETVFVVVGESGEYSDYRMWVVAAYISETEANGCAEDCDLKVKQWKRWLDERRKTSEWKEGQWSEEEALHKKTRLEMGIEPKCDEEAKYSVVEVPFDSPFAELAKRKVEE